MWFEHWQWTDPYPFSIWSSSTLHTREPKIFRKYWLLFFLAPSFILNVVICLASSKALPGIPIAKVSKDGSASLGYGTFGMCTVEGENCREVVPSTTVDYVQSLFPGTDLDVAQTALEKQAWSYWVVPVIVWNFFLVIISLCLGWARHYFGKGQGEDLDKGFTGLWWTRWITALFCVLLFVDDTLQSWQASTSNGLVQVKSGAYYFLLLWSMLISALLLFATLYFDSLYNYKIQTPLVKSSPKSSPRSSHPPVEKQGVEYQYGTIMKRVVTMVPKRVKWIVPKTRKTVLRP